MTDEAKNIALAVIVTVIIALVLLCVVSCLPSCAKADTVVAFGAEWCGPCREMRPIEADLVRAGYDIRYVDYDRDPARVKAFRVGPIPCFVALRQTATGWVETGRRVGKCTAAELRALCREVKK